MASICALATDGYGREMAVIPTGDQGAVVMSIMDGKRSATLWMRAEVKGAAKALL